MELNLQPRASSCFVSAQPFKEGDRVVSLLVRPEAGGILRYDALEASAASLAPGGFVACRWVQVFKPQLADENRDRTLKLTAETLFLTLADPATESTPESDRLVRFLALLLERKRLLRPRGKSADGTREFYEHARSKQMFSVPSIELGAEFFTAVREQLSVLVGEPRPADAAPAEPAASS